MPKCVRRQAVRNRQTNSHKNPFPLKPEIQNAIGQSHISLEIGPSPKYMKNNDVQDFLEEDPIISGQELVLMSFATLGESQREEAYKELSEKMSIRHEVHCPTCQKELDLVESVPLDTVKQIIEEWLEYNKHRRGIKIRGSFSNNEQGHKGIQKRIDYLKKTMSENYHIFVGEVGKWCPYDPDADDIEAQEYAEEQLNTMMKEHRIANEKAKIQFEERKKEMTERAILEGTPEGQKLLLEKDEPIEAIEHRIEAAKVTKEELLERLEETNRIQELAEKKLEFIKTQKESNIDEFDENKNVKVI